MNSSLPKAGISKEIIAEASQWFSGLLCGDSDARARGEFADWLLRSPEHVRAYLEVSGAWSELPPSDPAGHIDLARLLHAAQHEQATVVKLTTAPTQQAGAGPGTHRRRHAAVALAASVVLVLMGWMFLMLPATQMATYVTRIGEQRRIRLADDSVIDLSAHSTIKVRFSRAERSVFLEQGQAFFEVTKDAARPFVVRSDAASVRAVGTRFDVNRNVGGTVVTVMEGRVSVRAAQNEQDSSGAGAGAYGQATMLEAGEQSIVTDARVSAPKRVDAERVAAWIHDRLVFNNTPLAEVAEVFNRYSAQQLIIGDEGVRNLGVSGTYVTTEPKMLIEFLRAQPEMLVEVQDRQVVIRRR